MPMSGLLHVVSLWWALPRITIGKEHRTRWPIPIPWQLKFNFVVRVLGDKTVYCPWCEQEPF